MERVFRIEKYYIKMKNLSTNIYIPIIINCLQSPLYNFDSFNVTLDKFKFKHVIKYQC